MDGWIKLHRSFLKWEWYDSTKHFRIFLDLLLNANHKEKKYRGVLIKKGQLTTSYDAIGKRTGYSIQSVRTVLRDLKSTGEITHETKKNYSMISITNWDKFQGNDDRPTDQPTSYQHRPNIQVTTNKNEKKEKNKYMHDFESLYALYPKKEGRTRGLKSCKNQIKSKQDFEHLRTAILNYKKKLETEGTEKKYIKQFSTFMNCWRDFLVSDPGSGESIFDLFQDPKKYEDKEFTWLK